MVKVKRATVRATAHAINKPHRKRHVCSARRRSSSYEALLTLIRPRPIQGDGHVDFLGESEGSLPQPHDSLSDAGEAINDFWSMSGSFICRHHVEPRVKLYSLREESFPISLKYIDVTRTTHTNLDVKQFFFFCCLCPFFFVAFVLFFFCCLCPFFCCLCPFICCLCPAICVFVLIFASLS